jgi:hypothetical protein
VFFGDAAFTPEILENALQFFRERIEHLSYFR